MPVSKKNAQHITKQTAYSGGSFSIPKWVPFPVIIFTALLYSGALQNGITYWDDNVYILKNPLLRNFSADGIKIIFTTFINANYHPLTTLTNLVEYRVFGPDPLPYHLINVLLHLLNTWLVFRLTEKLSGKRLTALIVCVLFAVHPMHVESVAWLSERKDVLYASFYLLSLLAYLRYRQGFGYKQYSLALSLFIASCLSKSAAITLPVLLIAIDVYRGRNIDARALIEKIPFLLVSVLFGVLAIMSQKSGGAVYNLSATFGPVNGIFLFTTRIAYYIIQGVIPSGLCAQHYYPLTNGGFLPWYYYASLPLLALLAWLAARKNMYRKEVLFSMAFFLITISVMLQVVNIGVEYVAERYTYIPYIGLFYIAGQYASTAIDNKRNYVIGVLSVFIVVFSAQTWNRISAWKDTDTLFADMIEKNPGNWQNCYTYYAWGGYKTDQGDLQGAITDYSTAIKLAPGWEWPYMERGLLYDKTGDLQDALSDLNNALRIDPKRADGHNNRGWVYYELGNRSAAMLDYNTAIKYDPALTGAYNNRGWAYYEAGDMTRASADFNKAISLDPTFSKPYYNRALVKINMGNFKGALDDYSSILKFHPNDGLACFLKGKIYWDLKDAENACNDWHKSLELGNKDALKALQQYCR